MREFAKGFYKSRAWQRTSRAYAKSVGGLCERCAAKGLPVAGQIVHHRTPLTPENIHDPAVTLAWSNLELLCRDCHAACHPMQRRARYSVDKFGNVTAREAPPGPRPGPPGKTGEMGVEKALPRGKGGVKGGPEDQRPADQGGI